VEIEETVTDNPIISTTIKIHPVCIPYLFKS